MSAHEIRRPAYAPIRRTTTGATVTSVLRIPLASGEGAELDVGVIAVRRATGVPSFFRRVLRVQNVAGTVTAVSMTATWLVAAVSRIRRTSSSGTRPRGLDTP